MQRKLIKIDESLCNGCGNCVSSCAEGALKIINGKAKLVRKDYCDGLGACLGTCPAGALTLEDVGPVSAQWPLQLHLVNPSMASFKNKELVVLSTCSPVVSRDLHKKFLEGRSVVIACPKLDRTEPYVEKLAAIFRETSIPKVLVVIMEVPCCKGLSYMVSEAVRISGRTDLIIEEHIIKIS